MSVTFRVIALSLITTALFGGPLAPLARAQQPPPPAAPQSDLLQEALKATRGETPQRSYSVVYDVSAAAVDLFYIPGKIGLCGLGLAIGVAVLTVTIGSGYRFAVAAGEEGCGGKWVLTGRDLRPGESYSRSFDWEQEASR